MENILKCECTYSRVNVNNNVKPPASMFVYFVCIVFFILLIVAYKFVNQSKCIGVEISVRASINDN